MKEAEKITIVGTGFVGLITAAVFADKGFHTVALDIDEKKVNAVNKGETFFFEPNLSPLLQRVILKKKTLHASTESIKEIVESDVTFICVGTPSRKDGSCDLSYIIQSAKDIGAAIKKKSKYHLVVAKSTIVPKTTREVIKKTIEEVSGKEAGKDFGLCMSPEFLREGQSVHDTLYPDRIIIGEFDETSGQILEPLFQTLYKEVSDEFTKTWKEAYQKQIKCPPILHVSLETAECIKYANNSFLATKISFINEFANICERVEGVDINLVAKAIGLDFRINPQFLRAGAGFGGSCFPKDVKAMIHFAKEHNYTPRLLESVMEVNVHQALRMVELTEGLVGNLKGKIIAILGLSFKPDTDDMRSAPSIVIINQLLSKGAKVIAYDPKAIPEARKEEWLGEKIVYASSITEALTNANACLLVTEWAEFKDLQPKDFKIMTTPTIIDGRRIYNHLQFTSEGIKYAGIGLGLKR